MAETAFFLLAMCMVIVPSLSALTPTVSEDICHGQDCPKYTLLNKTADWELRRYDVVTWSSTNATAMDQDSTTSDLFRTLFNYIAGDNAQKAKIPMTTPVMNQIIHGQGPNCESEFIMHFMIPFDQWKSPIQPTNPKVSIVQTQSMDVFVRSFGGYPKGQEFLENVQNLADSLPKSVNVESKFFFTASYDSPYQIINRHNEVWLQKV